MPTIRDFIDPWHETSVVTEDNNDPFDSSSGAPRLPEPGTPRQLPNQPLAAPSPAPFDAPGAPAAPSASSAFEPGGPSGAAGTSTPPTAPPNPGAAPPPGYVAFGARGTPMQPLQATEGLRKATTTLFWLTVASGTILTFVLFSRKSVWDGFLVGDKSIVDLDDADALVAIATFITVAFQLAAAIVLSIWSLRVTRNAQSLGALGVRPGMACGGWYIPIGWLWVPWKHLRNAIVGVGQPSSNLNRWQGAFIAASVMGGIGQTAFTINSFDPGSVSDTLRNESIVSALEVSAMGVAAFFAMRAFREIEDKVASRMARHSTSAAPALPGSPPTAPR